MKIIKSIIKRFIWAYIRKYKDKLFRKLKAPRMIWGFTDSNGEYRSRTRISDTVFFYHQQRIKIADNVFVWHYSILDGTGGLEIGEGTQIGAWVGIFTHSSHIAIRLYGNHYQGIPESQKIGYPISPVKIGKFVFIGAGAKILPGVTIEEGSLISAGSIVTKDVPPHSIVSGNPAEIIGSTLKLDKRYLKSESQKYYYNQELLGEF